MKHYFKISETANNSFSGKKMDTVILMNRGGLRNQIHLRWNSLRQQLTFSPGTIVVKTFTSDVTELPKPHVQNGEIGVSVK